MSKKNLKREAIILRIMARQKLLQMLYQLITSENTPEQILENQLNNEDFSDLEDKEWNFEIRDFDEDYFNEAWNYIVAEKNKLDALIVKHSRRSISFIDPIERACAWIGFYELQKRNDIAPKVAINEAINLAKKFGSAEGYKFVNSLLDKYVKVKGEISN